MEQKFSLFKYIASCFLISKYRRSYLCECVETHYIEYTTRYSETSENRNKKCYKNEFCRQETATCSMLALQNAPLGSVLQCQHAAFGSYLSNIFQKIFFNISVCRGFTVTAVIRGQVILQQFNNNKILYSNCV